MSVGLLDPPKRRLRVSRPGHSSRHVEFVSGERLGGVLEREGVQTARSSMRLGGRPAKPDDELPDEDTAVLVAEDIIAG